MKLTILLMATLITMAFKSHCLNEKKYVVNTQFDFWIGEWDLTWNNNSMGTNVVRKELDEHVIQENFNDPVSKFEGKSWSVYDTLNKVWKQTWVDNQGGYIILTGKFENGKMILATYPVEKGGKSYISRMVFYNIATDSFDWDWEQSADGGTNWQLSWRIHYKRKS